MRNPCIQNPSSNRFRFASLLFGMLVACLMPVSGCAPPAGAANEDAQEKPQSIIGQTTDDITEFDPNAEGQDVNPESEVGGMFTYALETYGPTVGKISQLHIQQAVNLFWAEHGRYPESFEEFKERILIPNKIELPMLPGDAKYQYDVENHKLVIVAPKKD